MALATVALLAAVSKAGLITSQYNLISSPQFLVPQNYHSLPVPGIIPANQPDHSLAHPAVVENAIAESQLPPELLNPFYKNPTIAAGLAKESWFGDKEFPVHNREAEKIPRQEIYNIIKRLTSRRR